MRALAFALAALIAAIQFPLWLGRGGWLRVWEMDRQLAAQRAANAEREARNGALAAEVTDLKQGLEAVEERARYELGYVRNDEVFFQIVEKPVQPAQPGSESLGSE